MNKKLLALLMILMITFTTIPAMAANDRSDMTGNSAAVETVDRSGEIYGDIAERNPLIFKGTIVVSEEGGDFQVGFAHLIFKKDTLDGNSVPATFEIEIYMENGTAYIEMSPDTHNFNKKVMIKIDGYKGLLFDKEKGKNVEVNIKKQAFTVEHFSRYALR